MGDVKRAKQARASDRARLRARNLRELSAVMVGALRAVRADAVFTVRPDLRAVDASREVNSRTLEALRTRGLLEQIPVALIDGGVTFPTWRLTSRGERRLARAAPGQCGICDAHWFRDEPRPCACGERLTSEGVRVLLAKFADRTTGTTTGDDGGHWFALRVGWQSETGHYLVHRATYHEAELALEACVRVPADDAAETAPC